MPPLTTGRNSAQPPKNIPQPKVAFLWVPQTSGSPDRQGQRAARLLAGGASTSTGSAPTSTASSRTSAASTTSTSTTSGCRSCSASGGRGTSTTRRSPGTCSAGSASTSRRADGDLLPGIRPRQPVRDRPLPAQPPARSARSSRPSTGSSGRPTRGDPTARATAAAAPTASRRRPRYAGCCAERACETARRDAESTQQQGDEARPRLEELVEDLAEEHTSWIPIIAAVAAALSIVALVLLVHPLRDAVSDALSGDTASLRHDLKGFGFGGVLLVLALAISHAVLFYPAEILDAAVGLRLRRSGSAFRWSWPAGC